MRKTDVLVVEEIQVQPQHVTKYTHVNTAEGPVALGSDFRATAGAADHDQVSTNYCLHRKASANNRRVTSYCTPQHKHKHKHSRRL